MNNMQITLSRIGYTVEALDVVKAIHVTPEEFEELYKLKAPSSLWSATYKRRVNAALRRVSPRLRTVVLRSLHKGYTEDQIARFIWRWTRTA